MDGHPSLLPSRQPLPVSFHFSISIADAVTLHMEFLPKHNDVNELHKMLSGQKVQNRSYQMRSQEGHFNSQQTS
jgi:hypothetical protein